MNTVLEANQNSLSERRKKSEKLLHIYILHLGQLFWVVMGDDVMEKATEQLRSNAPSSNDFYLRP